MLWSHYSTVESLLNGLNLINLSFREIFHMFLMPKLPVENVVSI